MSIKDTVKKAAGLLFTFDESEGGSSAAPTPTRSVEQILNNTPGPNLEEIKAPNSPPKDTEPILRNDGKVSFAALYRMASLPDVPMSAEQVLELLNSLPPELPIETKRATLKVTLGAMTKSTGATLESVIADTSRKLAALEAYEENFGKQADQYVELANAEIQKYEAQIAAKKSAIADALAKKQMVATECNVESDRLDDILEFFSLDVSPSKLA